MDRAVVRGRRPFGCGTSGHRLQRRCIHQIACRPVPGLLALHRGFLRCNALSDGSPQGTSAALNPTLMGEAASQMELPENPHARAAPSLKSGRVDAAGGDGAHSKPESTWDEWLRHFDTMDELAEDAAHYQVELNTAVRQERYGDAARYKRKLQEIQAADTVAAVQRQLQDALASEQYGAAADLRDRGLVGLAGWWAGKDGPEDFQGHLLHVKPEFGRWTGRIYMARDIAAMNGWRENRLLARPDRSARGRAGAADSSSTGGLGAGTIGTPMMEVFVRQQQGAGSSSSGGGGGADQGQGQQPKLVPGLLVHQAVALRPPAPKGASRGSTGGKGAAAAAGAASAAAGTGGPAKLNPASVVRLSIHVARDGSARISVLPPQPIKSKFNSWEEEEMREAMAQLAGGDLKKPPQSRDRSSSPRPTAATGTATSSSLDDFQRPSDDEDDDDILTELTRMAAQVVLQGRDRFTFTVLEEGATPSSSSSANDPATGLSNPAAASASSSASSSSLVAAADGSDPRSSGSSVDLPRWAAVPIDEDDSSGDEGEAAAQRRSAAAAGALSDSEVPLMEVEVEVVEEDEAGPGQVRGGAPLGRRAFLDAVDESAARAAARRLEEEVEELFAEEEEENEVVEDDDEEEDGLEVSFDMLSTGYGKLDAVATSVSDGEEQQIVIEIPVGRLMRQQERAQQEQQRREAEEQRRMSGASASASDGAGSPAAAGPGSASGRPAKDTFDRLAERVAQLQAERAKRPVPPEHLAVALRTLAQRLINGELAADGSSSATASVPSEAAIEAQKAAAAAAARLQAASSPLASRPSSSTPSSSTSPTAPAPGARRVTYSRIPTDLPRSDPFCGLYLGAFGPHGPELIQLTRTLQDGEEVVCASKVTGDPNVPAGEVSFRAKVGRRHRLDSRDVYPEDLGIVARYKGEGRVAMAGYKSPRWVDGELLVFSGSASSATGGAELGFVWSVPGEKRFLILLNKLDLKECEK